MEFANKDETDVYLYLVDHGLDESVPKVFEGMYVQKFRLPDNLCLLWSPLLLASLVDLAQDIDGTSFLELTTDDLNKLFPDSLGTVKKVYRLVQSVSFIWEKERSGVGGNLFLNLVYIATRACAAKKWPP